MFKGFREPRSAKETCVPLQACLDGGELAANSERDFPFFLLLAFLSSRHPFRRTVSCAASSQTAYFSSCSLFRF